MLGVNKQPRTTRSWNRLLLVSSTSGGRKSKREEATWWWWWMAGLSQWYMMILGLRVAYTVVQCRTNSIKLYQRCTALLASSLFCHEVSFQFSVVHCPPQPKTQPLFTSKQESPKMAQWLVQCHIAPTGLLAIGAGDISPSLLAFACLPPPPRRHTSEIWMERWMDGRLLWG